MDTISAFAMGAANRGNEQKVFDWDTAAKIIKEKNAKTVYAGLGEDWDWTSGPILEDGKVVPREDTYVFLASTWATPQLICDNGDGDGDSDFIDCYKMQSEVPDWGANTYWPDSALSILNNP